MQGAEEVIEVGHYLRTAGEKATVGVEGGGLFIKVTGADIGVAGYFFTVSPRRRIRATLACTFRPGMLYIILMPAACIISAVARLFSSSKRAFSSTNTVTFLRLGGGYQGVDDGGVFRYAVLSYHDFTGFRVVHGFIQEVDEVLERVIRVI